MENSLEISCGLDLSVWWNDLEDQWKRAFNQAFFLKEDSYTPNMEELVALRTTSVLRFAGPKAPHPNISFALSNLSGISSFKELRIMIATHNELDNVDEIASLKKLKSIFVNDNKIKQISGLAAAFDLEECYLQNNEIDSLIALKKLVKLKALYCFGNKLRNLDGLVVEHSNNLVDFFCLPNQQLPNREVVRVEHELYIKCKKI